MHHHTRNRAEEHGIGRQVRGETIAVLEEVPRKHAKPHNRRYIASPANVLRAQGRDPWELGNGVYVRTMNRGNRAVRSQPAEMELVEVLVLRSPL
jgi:hypothetical protein